MIWIHGIMLAGIVLLWAGGKFGWFAYEKYVEKEVYRRIILVLLAGNFIGACVTWQTNQGRFLKDGYYLERPAHGEGSDSKVFIASARGQEVSISLNIPEQPGEDEELEVELTEEETLQEAILAAAAALNEERQEEDKYYLPANVDGDPISWAYPPDHSGMILLSLSALAGILLIIGKEREKERARLRRQEELLRDYPNLVTKLCLLVQAGMTMRRAFGKTALDYRRMQEKKQPPRPAYEEMLTTYYEMESGVMEAEAYENFGRRCGHPQYRTLATLLSQNLRKGGQGLLEILERESAAAFEDRKRQARIQGDAAATKLLMPMVLMLLVVLVILMVPAFLSFYNQ